MKRKEYHNFRDTTYSQIEDISNCIQWLLIRVEDKDLTTGEIVDFLRSRGFTYTDKSLRDLFRKLQGNEELGYMIPQVSLRKDKKTGRKYWRYTFVLDDCLRKCV